MKACFFLHSFLFLTILGTVLSLLSYFSSLLGDSEGIQLIYCLPGSTPRNRHLEVAKASDVNRAGFEAAFFVDCWGLLLFAGRVGG